MISYFTFKITTISPFIRKNFIFKKKNIDLNKDLNQISMSQEYYIKGWDIKQNKFKSKPYRNK